MSSRQAALALHALGPFDREWLLAQLADNERNLLIRHLNELESLGIPPDANFADLPRQRHDSVRSTIASAPLWRVAYVLEREPAWMQAQLLALGPWPWQADWIENLNEGMRKALTIQLNQKFASLPGPISTSLCNFFAEAIKNTPQSVVQVAGGVSMSGSNRFLQRVRKWLP